MKKRVKQIVSVMLITMMALQVLPMSVFTANAAGVTAGATWTDETTGIMYEYYEDISEFRTDKTDDSYSKHPEKAGHVFAGWWTEESVSSADGITNSAEAISVDKTDEGAWAKFVPEDVLTVKAQTSMKVSDALDKEGAVDENGNLTANSGAGIKLRLVTSVDDSDKYAEIGFKVKINSEQKIATEKFFKELTVTETEGASKISPKEVLDAKASGEFAVLVIGGFKTIARVNNTALNVTPYWITLDGTIVDGTNRARLLASDERANDADGSKTGDKEDFDVTDGIYEYDQTLVGDETSYKYFKGASDTVYLETKYTTAGANNHFGITIRNGGETRQVYFDNLGVKVLAGNSKTASGLVDKASDFYNTMKSEGEVYVWAQRSASTQIESTIKTMLAGQGTEHTVIWAIEKNVLYCSVDGHIVLRMPMAKLCEDWEAGSYYQLGVAAYNDANDASTTSQLNVTQEILEFGKTAKAELIPEDKELSKNKMTYEPITGSYLACSTNQDTADFTVDHVTGTGGVSANIELSTLYNMSEYARHGVYIGFNGNTYQFWVQGHNTSTMYQQNYMNDKLVDHVLNLGIKPYVNETTSKVTALIQDGHLYIYYNGTPAYCVNLQTLDSTYTTTTLITMGFCSFGMHDILGYFKDVKSMTQSDIQDMEELRFYSEDVLNVSSVDFANGTIANKGSQSTATRVDFMGESDRWEVTGTMYVDEDVTTGRMYPQFFVTDGNTTFSPRLCYQGPLLSNSDDWNYTGGNNSNTANGTLTFNKDKTETDKFVNHKPEEHDNARTKFEMDFKVVIVNDVMYVWFESDTEQGKMVPSWRLPLTTPIYETDGTTSLFSGFTSSDLQYTFGLGNTSGCASGGYKNLTVRTGDAVDITCFSNSSDFLNYTVEVDEETKLPTVTHTGSAAATLDVLVPVGANDDVYVEAVLKQGDQFNMTNLRYGFLFGDVRFDVTMDNTKGLLLQMADHTTYISYELNDVEEQAFAGDGLRIGVARRGGKFYMYLERDGKMECVLKDQDGKLGSYAKSEFNIQLSTAVSAKGAVYSNLKLEKGSKIYCRDPFIMPYEGKYYLYSTGSSSGIVCRVSENLITWSEPQNVFTPPDDFHGVDNFFWAPECHYYNGKFYIFTSVKSSTCGKRVISSYVSDSPLGPFTEQAILTPTDWDSIDGTLYIDEENQPWLVFSREWTSAPNETGVMYCAKLNNDLSAFISDPHYMFNAKEPDWNAHAVTDAPFMYKTANGKLLMIWSNYATEDRGYVVAVSESKTGKVDASSYRSWIHHNELLFDKDGGHGMIFKTFEGELMLALHAPNTATETDRPHLVILELEEKDDMLYLKDVIDTSGGGEWDSDTNLEDLLNSASF